jgi:hypothetical protein
MDLYPLSDEVKEHVAMLRALIAEAIAKNDEDSKLLTAEENVPQLQEDDLVRYIKARKFVVRQRREWRRFPESYCPVRLPTRISN